MKIIIPARLDSGRVPKKPLRVIGTKTVIEHACEGAAIAAEKLGAEMIVAVDSDDVYETVTHHGYTAVDTRVVSDREPDNGTERVAMVARLLDLHPSEPVINVQGDKWGVVPEAVCQLAREMQKHSATAAFMRHYTLYCLCEALSVKDREDKSVVKVVTGAGDRALFFTRANVQYAYKHCGIYGYSASFLYTYLEWPQRTLEYNEALEQMRVLENNGIVICPRLTDVPTAGGTINTMADLDAARALYRAAMSVG